jgi:hypothetical protein
VTKGITTWSDSTGQLWPIKGVDAVGRLYSKDPDSGFWVRVEDYTDPLQRIAAVANECLSLAEVAYPIREVD